MAGLDHERLEVYRMAIALVVEVAELAREVPRGHSYIIDQLLRSVTSIPLNIAEGAGEFRGREKARFYRIARRSATECASALDVIVAMKLIHPRRVEAAKSMIERTVSMLIRLGESAVRQTERKRERAPARARQVPPHA